MKPYVLSETADADLLDMFDHGLETFGRAQAERYLSEVLKTLDRLATFPQMARERSGASIAVRVHSHASHYIAYLDREDHIYIVRILRAEADLAAFLSGIEGP